MSKDLLQQLLAVEFETKCEACNGEGNVGWHEYKQHKTICEECSGHGWKPTEIGKKLLALVSHNMRVVACPACDGEGKEDDYYGPYDCSKCGGIGAAAEGLARDVISTASWVKPIKDE